MSWPPWGTCAISVWLRLLNTSGFSVMLSDIATLMSMYSIRNPLPANIVSSSVTKQPTVAMPQIIIDLLMLPR